MVSDWLDVGPHLQARQARSSSPSLLVTRCETGIQSHVCWTSLWQCSWDSRCPYVIEDGIRLNRWVVLLFKQQLVTGHLLPLSNTVIQGDPESEAGSRLRAASTEPNAGLELTNREIIT